MNDSAMNNLLTGELVKLAANDPEKDPAVMEIWHRDSEFFQLGYGRIAQPWTAKMLRQRIEGSAGEANEPVFAIHTIAEDKLIGQMGMWIDQPHGDAYVWILIGERAYWGKGYGTDAMRVFMRYAFEEMNLHRLTLRVFGFNQRAIRSYEKCGFAHEGKSRGSMQRMGQRWDEFWMGITRADWEHSKAQA
jgi:RimJ/RimL family protein N-acetyltransferase